MVSYSKFLEIRGCQRTVKRRIGKTVLRFSPALSCLGSVEFLAGRKRNVFVTDKISSLPCDLGNWLRDKLDESFRYVFW